MCKKPFDSLIFNFFFFATSYGALSATSGGALLLGSKLLSLKHPDNSEYTYYTSNDGFLIGLKSGLFFQWITAGFCTMFIKINMSETIAKKCAYTFLCNATQGLLSLGIFMALHYPTLPQSVTNQKECLDFKIKSDINPVKNDPLCDPSHDWQPLFTAFYLGSSIIFSGCATLYFISLCFCKICESIQLDETQTQPITPPNSNAVLFEMIQLTHPISLQPSLFQPNLESSENAGTIVPIAPAIAPPTI